MKDELHHSRRQAIGAVGCALLATSAGAAQPAEKSTGRSATVILVRHAEKLVDGTDDPALSELGHKRAAALAGLVQAAGVTRIFATEFRRTQETVAPACERLKTTSEPYAARESEAFAARLAGMDDGACVLAAGHSNTVPAIVRALGGELKGLDKRGFFDESEYDRVIVLTLHARADERMVALRTLDLRVVMGE